MNTTERIVESYFRLCRGCFTRSDVKVAGGNNRQIDLLAVNLQKNRQYHVETSVTHELSWRATWQKLEEKFDAKFFGAPRKKEGPKTDYTRGKSYFGEIKKTYREAGIKPSEVRRVWVTWVIPSDDGFESELARYCRGKRLGSRSIKVLSFRDELLPELIETVGKANYDDDVLRTLSLLQQYEKQNANEQWGLNSDW